MNLKNTNGIEKFYETIETKINEFHGEVATLGCVCICLYYQNYESYMNNALKQIVEKGKEHGFVKVQFTNRYDTEYLRYELHHKPKSGDVILINMPTYWCMYEVIDGKAKFLKGNNKLLSDDDLNGIRNGHYRNPNIVFNCSNNDSLEKVKRAFLGIEAVQQTYINDSEAALLKARILANDAEVLGYDVLPTLWCKIGVKCNENEIMSFEETQVLPTEIVTELYGKDGDKFTVVSYLNPLNCNGNGIHEQEIFNICISATFIYPTFRQRKKELTKL